MYPCINRNARPNNNQLITYYERVNYLQEWLQHIVEFNDNKILFQTFESLNKTKFSMMCCLRASKFEQTFEYFC